MNLGYIYIFKWTEANIQQAISLWQRGMTAGEIADEINCPSRNAVIGKLTRLGVAGNRRGKQNPAPYHRAPNKPLEKLERKKHQRRQGLSPEWKDTKESDRPELSQLRSNQCRYPYGSQTPYNFCGQESHPARSYCPHHDILTRAMHRTKEDEQSAA